MSKKIIKIFNIFLLSSSFLSSSSTEAFSSNTLPVSIQSIFANFRVNNTPIVRNQVPQNRLTKLFGGFNRSTTVAQSTSRLTISKTSFTRLFAGRNRSTAVTQSTLTAPKTSFAGLFAGRNRSTSVTQSTLTAPKTSFVGLFAGRNRSTSVTQSTLTAPKTSFAGLFAGRNRSTAVTQNTQLPSPIIRKQSLDSLITKQDPLTTIETLRQKINSDIEKNHWLIMTSTEKYVFILKNIINENFSLVLDGVEANQYRKDQIRDNFINSSAHFFNLNDLTLPMNFNDFFNNFGKYITPILNNLKIRLGQNPTNTFKVYPKVSHLYNNINDIIINWKTMSQQQKIIDFFNQELCDFTMIDVDPSIKSTSIVTKEQLHKLSVNKYSHELNKYLIENNIGLSNNIVEFIEFHNSVISPFVKGIGGQLKDTIIDLNSNNEVRKIITQDRKDYERENLLSWLPKVQQALSQKSDTELLISFLNSGPRFGDRGSWRHFRNDHKIIIMVDFLLKNEETKILCKLPMDEDSTKNLKSEISRIVRVNNIQIPNRVIIEEFLKNIDTYMRPVFSKYKIDEDRIS